MAEPRALGGPANEAGDIGEDGAVAAWPPLLGGLAPFLIDWGDARHPSTTAVKGARLASWHGEHPDVATVRRAHVAMGVELELQEGPEPALIAVIEGPSGTITLR